MQYRPSPAELLAALAELLENTLLPALPPALQHQARVGANLARILERESTLGAHERERELLVALTGVDGGVDELGSVLAARLRETDDPAFERSAWAALVEIVRSDVAVAKPGHADWAGR